MAPISFFFKVWSVCGIDDVFLLTELILLKGHPRRWLASWTKEVRLKTPTLPSLKAGRFKTLHQEDYVAIFYFEILASWMSEDRAQLRHTPAPWWGSGNHEVISVRLATVEELGPRSFLIEPILSRMRGENQHILISFRFSSSITKNCLDGWTLMARKDLPRPVFAGKQHLESSIWIMILPLTINMNEKLVCY